MPPVVSISEYQFPTNEKKPNWKIISIIVAVSIVILSVAIITVIIVSNNNSLHSNVKNKLTNATKQIEEKKLLSGAYPISIDEYLKSEDDVVIVGSTSYDGIDYCVSATSQKDAGVVYHKTAKDVEPVSGDCAAVASVSMPQKPGGLAVAFASKDSIRITWNSTNFASSYTLDCSASDDFKKTISVNSNETGATCEGLEADTLYFYRVRAINNNGSSDWSDVYSIKTFELAK